MGFFSIFLKNKKLGRKTKLNEKSGLVEEGSDPVNNGMTALWEHWN